MNEAVVFADSLCRSFGGANALHQVSISIEPGTVCSILGPNGAGKSTWLRLLLGLLLPTSGTCTIAGDGEIPRSKHAMQSTGCLLDDTQPPGHISIQQLISLNENVGPAFDRARATQMLESKKLGSETLWRTLSKGQKRWVALAMLLCRGCNILLLDEPADGLDLHARSELYQLIRREANERSVAAMITTHVINDIEKISDEVCILHQGRIILCEPLEDLREQFLTIVLEDVSAIPSDVQIIHQVRQRSSKLTMVWVRDIMGCLENIVLAGEVRRSPVNLEQLYFAIIAQHEKNIALASK